MQMDDEFLEVNDLDWFASYPDGTLAHFATAGHGFVPDSVRISISDYELLFDYFCSLAEISDCEIEEGNLKVFDSPAKRERFLQSFISMAKKGLYSYDADNGSYKLIAKPSVALKVVDLPKEIHAVLGEISVAFSEDARVLRDFAVK